MRWFVFRNLLVSALVVMPGVAGADSQSDAGSGIAAHIVISELQTGSKTDASQEFVELYNPTSSDVGLDGWQLQYKSATGSSWSKKLSISGVVAANKYVLFSSTGYLSQADGFFASGLSGTAGHVRIV